ncbi:MAG: aminotransferase class IV [Gemmataceae bacterium]
MTPNLAYWNGAIVPLKEARLSPFDLGFVSGVTIVDVLRTYRQQLFRWDAHQSRFETDCRACGVPCGTTRSERWAIAEELLAPWRETRPQEELMLTMVATPGPPAGPPSFGMFLRLVERERNRRFYTEGVHLEVVGHQQVDTAGLLPPSIKHRSRLLWWLADQAPRPSGSIGLLTNGRDGSITETAIGNVLAVREGVVLTPPRATILDGISLQVIEERSIGLGWRFAEAELLPKEAAQWSEMIFTGTGFGVVGVRQLGDHTFDWPGPYTLQLLHAWDQLTGIDSKLWFTGAG